jgi:hypothetical protein
MGKWSIYDYEHPQRGNLMAGWSARLQKKEKAKLDMKVDALAMHGLGLIPGMLAPTGTSSIFKLRVAGKVALRPMLCEGPSDQETFTFLLGAIEVQWEYDPPNAPQTAAEYRNDLIANPSRRCLHERTH